MKKVRNFCIGLLLMQLLVGCGWYERQVAHYTGSAEVCHDGVVYIQFTSGVTVKYKPDGSIATCTN